MTAVDKTESLDHYVRRARNLRARTKALYVAAVERFVQFAGTDPADWTKDKVIAWQKNLRQEHKLRPQTINLHVRAVQCAASNRARALDIPDFSEGVETLTESSSTAQKNPLSVEQVKKILATTNEDRPIDLRDRAILLVGFRNGLKRSAVRGITVDALSGNRLTVPTRGGNTLTIPIDAEVRRALQVWITWLARQGVTEGPVFRGLYKQHKEDGTVGIRDEALSEDAIWWIVQERAQKAGLRTNITRRIFRDTFVEWCRREKIEPDRVRAMTAIAAHEKNLKEPISDQLPSLME